MNVLFRKLPRNRCISYEAAAWTDGSDPVEHDFETFGSGIQVQLINQCFFSLSLKVLK